MLATTLFIAREGSDATSRVVWVVSLHVEGEDEGIRTPDLQGHNLAL